MIDNRPESEPEMRQSTYRAIPAPRRNISQESRQRTAPPTSPARSEEGGELFPEPAPAYVPPATADEAEKRYWKKWEPFMVDLLFGGVVAMPETLDEWTALAAATRDLVRAREAAHAAVQRSASEPLK